MSDSKTSSLARFTHPTEPFDQRWPRRRRCWKAGRSLLLVVSLVSIAGPGPHLAKADSPPSAVGQPDRLGGVRPEDPAAEEAHRIATLASVSPTVLAIYGDDFTAGGGSGVLIDERGLALTNHHVIEGSAGGGWAGQTGGTLSRWTLIGTDPGGDLALIQLVPAESQALTTEPDPPSGASAPSPDGAGTLPTPIEDAAEATGIRWPYAPLGDSDAAVVGQSVYAAGNPFGLADDQSPTITAGLISGVRRFQKGQGGALLVYGECLQVDAAINPGNSGGPLFDRGGRILGIVGRGSFQDRGRVNVGLGYAVGINQAVRFLPDLLATKVARHGALDAVFGDRNGAVICEGLALDSPIAQAGMALGDRLVAFEGEPIASANEFASRLTTYPEGWPVRLIVERDGRQRTLVSRLLPMAYPVPPGRPEAAEPPGDDADGQPSDSPSSEIPSEQPEPQAPREPSVVLDLATAGQHRDADQNARHAVRLLRDAARRFAGNRSGQPPGNGRASDGTSSDTKTTVAVLALRYESVGNHTKNSVDTILFSDGRFDVTERHDGVVHRTRFDGVKFHITAPSVNGAAPRETAMNLDEALTLLRRPAVAAAAWTAAFWTWGSSEADHVARLGTNRDPTDAGLRHPAWLDGLTISLDGSDAFRGKAAYRLRLTDRRRDWHHLWLSVIQNDGTLQPDWLGSGANLDGSSERPNLGVGRWVSIGPSRVPGELAQIVGPEGRAEAVMRLTHAQHGLEPVDAASDQILNAMPGWETVAESRFEDMIDPPTASQRVLSPIEQNRHDAATYAQARTAKLYGAGIGKIIGYGTGTIVSSEGDIVTVSGAYLGADTLRVVLPDGTTHPGTVVRRSESPPLAHIKIDAATPAFFLLSPSSDERRLQGASPRVAEVKRADAGEVSVTPAIGEPVLAFSHAFKVAEGPEPVSCFGGLVAGRGMVTSRRGRVISPWTGPWLLLDAIVSNPGGGGGPVTRTDGQLLGLTGPELVAEPTGTRLNAAIPVDVLTAWWQRTPDDAIDLARTPSDAKAVETEPRPPLANQLQKPGIVGLHLFRLGGRRGPAFIDRVDAGTPAAEAGLQPDDQIVTVENVRIRDVEHFETLEPTFLEGKTIEFVVRRLGRLITVRLTPIAQGTR